MSNPHQPPPFPVSWVSHTGRVCAGAWSPDGKYIAVGGFGGDIQVFDALSGNDVYPSFPAVQSDERYNSVSVIAWSPDGKYIASGGDDKRATVWQVLA